MKAVRGGVFVASLGSIGTKLVLVVSDDGINLGAQQPIVARVTDNSRDRTFPTHVELDRGDGGIDEVSYVLCHDLTTLRSSDLVTYLGQIPIEKLWKVETALRQALRL